MHPSIVALLPELRRRADRARHAFNVWNRGGWEQGGYVHDTAVTVFIPPGACMLTVGAWVDTVGAVANTYMKRGTAAAATWVLVIPIFPIQNAVALKGSYFKSLDMWWINGTAALTTFTAAFRRAVPPLNAAAYGAPTADAFAYDANHLANANRITVAQHTMVLTPTTPMWLANSDQFYGEFTIVNPGTSVLDFYGARANFTLRI
jgi:hypothetical protein